MDSPAVPGRVQAQSPVDLRLRPKLLHRGTAISQRASGCLEWDAGSSGCIWPFQGNLIVKWIL